MSRDKCPNKFSKVPAQAGTKTQQPAPELGSRSVAEKATSRAELEVFRQKVVDLIGQKPAKAAVVLSDWIKQPAGKKKAG